MGINFFDTANMYSQGSSEEILGRALRDFAARDDVVIATKLRRLGTDYVDLYQIHRNDPSTPLAEYLEALHDLVKAGKVRYLGASSMHAWEFAKALHTQRANGWARFVSMQDHYNLLAREEEREMIPLCLDEGGGTIVWSPLARAASRARGARRRRPSAARRTRSPTCFTWRRTPRATRRSSTQDPPHRRRRVLIGHRADAGGARGAGTALRPAPRPAGHLRRPRTAGRDGPDPAVRDRVVTGQENGVTGRSCATPSISMSTFSL